jgi:CBS domain-containing protein
VKYAERFAVTAALLLLAQTGLADEVALPAPVLKWSLYILLIFALSVVVGIFFFKKGKTGEFETLENLLSRKHGVIQAVGPETTVTDCVRQMNDHRVGALLVQEGEKLLGIFTERDALTRVLGAGLDPLRTPVSKVMSKNPLCVAPSTTLEEAMSIITNQRIRHLPVVLDDKVLGVISSGDLTHKLVEDQAGEIREQVNIAGRRGASQ